MTLKTFTRLAAVPVLAGARLLGMAVPGAFAAATTLPATALGPIYPSPAPNLNLPSGGSGVRIVGNCPSPLFSQGVGFVFNSGNAVEYGPTSHPATAGANVEGNATLVLTTVVDGVPAYPPTFTEYSGHTHLWFGSNVNPTGNSQSVFAETIMFNGSTPDGQTISITANPGGTESASGHQSGWGHLNLICS